MTGCDESGLGDSTGSFDPQPEELAEQIIKLVNIPTFRTTPFDPKLEEVVQLGLNSIKGEFDKRIVEFNTAGNGPQIVGFEWQEEEEPLDRPRYRVFGYRLGEGPRKTTLICHLDTVPPGSSDWNPLQGRVETRVYKGAPQQFVIGRGAIDDKGPAVVAFNTLLKVAGEVRGAIKPEVANDPLHGVTFEVLFDTSEETDMSTPKYFVAHPEQLPELGVVFDAYWSVRAEKGIVRPVFSIQDNAVPEAASGSLHISGFQAAPGSTNMIPDWVTAWVSGPSDQLKSFAENVATWYRACTFDDLDYHPADLSVACCPPNSEVVTTVQLTATVAGAQHGSAANDNRRNGANPLVSLTCFLAILIERGILANNANGEMTKFIKWAFGTKVFGENHPDLLYRYDPVFTEGNGTTYALTQLAHQGDVLELRLDIRYAIGHHSLGWDGSEGVISGESLFEGVFRQLVSRYQTDCAGAKVGFVTTTISDFGPDVRSLRNANLSRVAMAYRSVMGENCPMHATGGATDAHGIASLVAAGSLFTTDFGPPVNYHGIDEGAPLVDLENSAKILHNLLSQDLAP